MVYFEGNFPTDSRAKFLERWGDCFCWFVSQQTNSQKSSKNLNKYPPGNESISHLWKRKNHHLQKCCLREGICDRFQEGMYICIYKLEIYELIQYNIKK